MARPPRSAMVAWAVLVVASTASWWAGGAHGLAREAAGTVVLVLATVKAGLVALEFMELRTAPAALRLAVLAEIVVGGAALVVLYVSGGP